jgi:hypothetical protein
MFQSAGSLRWGIKCTSIPPVSCLESVFFASLRPLAAIHLQHDSDNMKIRVGPCMRNKCSSIPPVSCLERGFCVASAIIMLYHLQHEFEKMKMRVGPCKKKSALLPAFALCLLSVTACSALTPMQSISFSVGLGVFEIHGAQLLR